MTPDGLKRCPYCAEFIQLPAIICRYCGRDVTEPRYQLTGFSRILIILGVAFLLLRACR